MHRFVPLLLAIPLMMSPAGMAGAQQQQTAATNNLIGTWILKKWWNVADDGHEMPSPIEGNDMQGLLMFDAAGRYSLIIASDRPKWKSPDRMEGTAEENRAAARGALAYFGTYSVNQSDHTFTLHVERSLHPNINGTDQKRSFSVSGDELSFHTPPFKYPKGTFTGYFTWTRIK